MASSAVIQQPCRDPNPGVWVPTAQSSQLQNKGSSSELICVSSVVNAYGKDGFVDIYPHGINNASHFSGLDSCPRPHQVSVDTGQTTNAVP